MIEFSIFQSNSSIKIQLLIFFNLDSVEIIIDEKYL